jgi:hypothetical protein
VVRLTSRPAPAGRFDKPHTDLYHKDRRLLFSGPLLRKGALRHRRCGSDRRRACAARFKVVPRRVFLFNDLLVFSEDRPDDVSAHAPHTAHRTRGRALCRAALTVERGSQGSGPRYEMKQVVRLATTRVEDSDTAIPGIVFG